MSRELKNNNWLKCLLESLFQSSDIILLAFENNFSAGTIPMRVKLLMAKSFKRLSGVSCQYFMIHHFECILIKVIS